MATKNSAKAKWLQGKVHWYDQKSGEGMIRSNDGNVYYVQSSAIDDFVTSKRNKEKTLKDKQEVQFQLLEDTTFVQVSRVKEA